MYPYHVQCLSTSNLGIMPNRWKFVIGLVSTIVSIQLVLWWDSIYPWWCEMHVQFTCVARNLASCHCENLQHWFGVTVSCGILYNQPIGPFVFKSCLAGYIYLRFLQGELPPLLDKYLWQHDCTCISNMMELVPISSVQWICMFMIASLVGGSVVVHKIGWSGLGT
jgi:hypothetical protein